MPSSDQSLEENNEKHEKKKRRPMRIQDEEQNPCLKVCRKLFSINLEIGTVDIKLIYRFYLLS